MQPAESIAIHATKSAMKQQQQQRRGSHHTHTVRFADMSGMTVDNYGTHHHPASHSVLIHTHHHTQPVLNGNLDKLNSDGEGSISDGHSDSDLSSASGYGSNVSTMSTLGSSTSVPRFATFSLGPQDKEGESGEEGEVDNEEVKCLKHLDVLGMELEKTFKKVDSIGK
jgi:hypothetical protein